MNTDVWKKWLKRKCKGGISEAVSWRVMGWQTLIEFGTLPSPECHHLCCYVQDLLDAHL